MVRLLPMHELLDDGVQVIVVTHDDRTIKEIHHMYERLPAIGCALAVGKPCDGTTATRTSNTAETLLQHAKVYINSPDPQLRRSGANKLREAAEPIAKKIIVNSRNDNGDACSITDYDGVTLGPLIRKVTPYMTKPDNPVNGRSGEERAERRLRLLEQFREGLPAPEARRRHLTSTLTTDRLG